MSTAKTTATKSTKKEAPAKKAPVAKKEAPAKAVKPAPAKKEAPAKVTKPAPAKKETAQVKSNLDMLFEGLPKKATEYTKETLVILQKRYGELKAKEVLTPAEAEKAIAIGKAATAHVKSLETKAPAKAPKAPAEEVTVGEVNAKELASLAAEMNDVMDLTPKVISGKEDTLERVMAELKFLAPTDFVGKKADDKVFTAKAAEVIKRLGITLPGGKKAAKAQAATALKPAKASKATKTDDSGESSAFGHRLNTFGGQMDVLLQKGGINVKGLVEQVGCSKVRVYRHLQALAAGGVNVVKDENGIYSVK